MINRRRFIQASALLIAGTSTLALTGCGSPKTPEDVACAFVRALYRGDAAEATKFFHVPADAKDAEVKIAEAKISESAAQAKDSATKQGGLRRRLHHGTRRQGSHRGRQVSCPRQGGFRQRLEQGRDRPAHQDREGLARHLRPLIPLS